MASCNFPSSLYFNPYICIKKFSSPIFTICFSNLSNPFYGGMKFMDRGWTKLVITSKSFHKSNKKKPTEIISKPFSREDRIRTCDPPALKRDILPG